MGRSNGVGLLFGSSESIKNGQSFPKHGGVWLKISFLEP